MVFFGRDNTLFVEKPHAWVNGPVYPAVYHKYKETVPGMCDHLNFSHFGCEEGAIHILFFDPYHEINP